jgi:hypothetical protein
MDVNNAKTKQHALNALPTESKQSRALV